VNGYWNTSLVYSRNVGETWKEYYASEEVITIECTFILAASWRWEGELVARLEQVLQFYLLKRREKKQWVYMTPVLGKRGGDSHNGHLLNT